MNTKNSKVGKLSKENAYPNYVVIYKSVGDSSEKIVIVKHDELAGVVARYGLDHIIGCYELGAKVKVHALTISVGYN